MIQGQPPRGQISIRWALRSREPAKSRPDPNYPYGIALDFTAGEEKTCLVKLAYPAPGVGTWFLKCKTCGFTGMVTAAGRADDPTQVTIPCKSKDAQNGERIARKGIF